MKSEHQEAIQKLVRDLKTTLNGHKWTWRQQHLLINAGKMIEQVLGEE